MGSVGDVEVQLVVGAGIDVLDHQRGSILGSGSAFLLNQLKKVSKGTHHLRGAVGRVNDDCRYVVAGVAAFGEVWWTLLGLRGLSFWPIILDIDVEVVSRSRYKLAVDFRAGSNGGEVNGA